MKGFCRRLAFKRRLKKLGNNPMKLREAKLSSPNMKRDVKFLSNERVLRLHESLVRKTNFSRKVFVQGSLLREE